jgi:hypothetical protein
MTPRIANLTKDELVRLLKSQRSRTITEETLAADIAAGAPVNENGTMSLIEYAAWILKGNLNGD